MYTNIIFRTKCLRPMCQIGGKCLYSLEKLMKLALSQLIQPSSTFIWFEITYILCLHWQIYKVTKRLSAHHSIKVYGAHLWFYLTQTSSIREILEQVSFKYVWSYSSTSLIVKRVHILLLIQFLLSFVSSVCIVF